jgi:hypothetical protein
MIEARSKTARGLYGGLLAILVAMAGAHLNPVGVERLAASPECRGGGKSLLRTELYLGRSRRDGTQVSDEAFRTFLDSIVAPRFPDGFAILAGIGQYRGASGAVIRERSLVFVVLHPPEARAGTRIEEIRDAYRNAFGQESVLRVDVNACASF